MLSRELRTFLKWLGKQSAPVSKSTMENLRAPEYSSERIEELRETGYIIRDLSVENGSSSLVGVYSISDKGRAELQERDEVSKEKAIEWVRYGITTAIAVIALIRTFL